MDAVDLTAGLHQAADRVPTVAPRTADLTDVPLPRITGVGCQPMVVAHMVVPLPLTGVGLQVTVADRIAGQRLPTVAEEPHRMGEAEQCPPTVAAVTLADSAAAGMHLPAVVAATAAAVEVGTVAAGITELRSHTIFQQRRLRAALLLWVR